MNWLHVTAVIFHMLLAAGIVGLVLLQRGRGADAGAGFGAGASGTVFGARGSSSFLSRTTAVLAALFFVTSLTLTYLGGRQTAPTSVIDRLPQPAAPATSGSSSGNNPAQQSTLQIPSDGPQPESSPPVDSTQSQPK